MANPSENKLAESIVENGLVQFGYMGIKDTRTMDRDTPLFSVNQVRIMLHQYLKEIKPDEDEREY